MLEGPDGESHARGPAVRGGGWSRRRGVTPSPSPLPSARSGPRAAPRSHRRPRPARVERLEAQVKELEAALAALRAGGADAERLRELERRLEILSRELESLRAGDSAVAADEPRHGFGPAASKVYRVERGVSFGGYGELLYQNFEGQRDDGADVTARDTFDLQRVILYAGYKFNDRVVFNSEIEFEHATTGSGADDRGEVSVEFAYVDVSLSPKIGVRGGLLLVPMGFVNELHEPTVFLGAKRPDVERLIIPSTWRENGAGLFGDIGPVSYRVYLINGFDGAGLRADGFSAAGVRGGRQSGSAALAEDFALVGRVDWHVTPGLTFGFSGYTGNSGQAAVAPTSGQTIEARTTILDARAEWRWRGLEARALWAQGRVDEADLLNDALGLIGAASVGERMEGYYLQAGYDVLSGADSTDQALIPFFRYETFDTQQQVPAGFIADPARDVRVLTGGIAWKPLPQLVLKADYQDYDNGAQTGVDQWNLALGWVF